MSIESFSRFLHIFASYINNITPINSVIQRKRIIAKSNKYLRTPGAKYSKTVYMKLIKNNIPFIVLVLFAYATFFGCSNEDDTQLLTQKTNFVSFLEKLGDSIPYHSVGDSYYFVAANSNSPSVTPVTVEEGDVVSIYYEGYVFSSSATGGKGGLFTSNNPTVIATMGLTEGAVEAGPTKVTVGSSPLIKGLSNVMPYGTKGDSLMVYIPFTEGYGSSYFNIVPPYSPLTYIVQIIDVEKN